MKVELIAKDIGHEEMAIRKTLEYADIDVPITIFQDEETNEGLILVVSDGDHETRLHGFLPAFMFASRNAHTLPKDPLHCGIVVDRLEFVKKSTLRQLEDSMEDKQWMCDGELKGSSAADFYLHSRLQRVDTDDKDILDEFPNLKRYMEQDPSCVYGSESEEGGSPSISRRDEVVPEPETSGTGISVRMCLVQ